MLKLRVPELVVADLDSELRAGQEVETGVESCARAQQVLNLGVRFGRGDADAIEAPLVLRPRS